MKTIHDLDEAHLYLREGKIIAYPTEAVFGLGCDPFNPLAVQKLLALKERDVNKGLILIINDWSQLLSLIEKVPEDLLEKVRTTWPGPVTWVFPKAKSVPEWLSGRYPSIAIRMSAHPIAQQLCKEGPLVSTSANRSGLEPAMDEQGLRDQFPTGIDAFIPGALGGALRPSAIFDVLSGQRLR
jgi:L-threonylcarbamoyladenylate synthase